MSMLLWLALPFHGGPPRSRCGHYILPCGFFYLLLLSSSSI